MTTRMELPEPARMVEIDDVFELRLQAKMRLDHLSGMLRSLPLDYGKAPADLEPLADQLLQIYDEADESIAAVRSIVEAEVLAKFRRPADSDGL